MAKKKAKRKNPKRRTAHRRNPKRKAAKRRNPAKRRTARRNPKRTTHRRRNPARVAAHRPRRRNSRRRRRSNPGWSNGTTALAALAAGVGAAVASSWINDGPLGNSGQAMQNLALVLEGAAAIYWIENEAIMSGVVVGLGLVQAGNLIYSVFPTLAAPGASAVVVAGGPSMGALHKRTVRKLRGFDGKIAALHRGYGALHSGYGTLHRNMGALHRGQPMGRLEFGAPGSMGAMTPSLGTSQVRGFSRYTR